MQDLESQIQGATAALCELVAQGFGEEIDLTKLPMDWVFRGKRDL